MIHTKKWLGIILVSLLVLVGLSVILIPETGAYPPPRYLTFAGYQWRARWYDGSPGPDYWCDNVDAAWIDGAGHAHLKLQEFGSDWYAAELRSETAMGYGTYTWTTSSDLSNLDMNVVVSPFLHDPQRLDAGTREIDVEWAQWSDPAYAALYRGKYTVMPMTDEDAYVDSDWNIPTSSGNVTSTIVWQSNSVAFHTEWTDNAQVLASWTYTPADYLQMIPQQETCWDMRPYMQVWLTGHATETDQHPTDNNPVEIEFTNFTYTPSGSGGGLTLPTDPGYYSAGYAQDDTSTGGIPTVSTQEATYVTPTTARLNGHVDYSGGSGSCWTRFQYGVADVAEVSTAWVPGAITGASVYSDISGLLNLTEYKFRVQAYNLITGIGAPESGATLTFTTCDDVGDPTYLFADPISSTEIDLSWVMGSCSDRSIVRYSPTDYPATENSDLSAYYGIESVYSLSGLLPGTTYYFRVWSTEQTGNYVSDNYSEAVATTPAGSGGTVPYLFGDTANWFTDPDCTRITGLPFYSGVANAAAGIGWDICVMFVFLIFILTIVAGLVTAIASKGNLTAVLIVMGMVLLIGVVAGPLPKAWFIIYLTFSIPTGYLLPKGAGV